MFNFAMLVLRVAFGCAMLINHGMPKLFKFDEMVGRFYNFLGLGAKISLLLVIFAEVFCSLFIILGLFTRLAAIPLIIMLLVILFAVHGGDPFSKIELPVLFLTAFSVLLFVGPGRVSIDGMINK